MAKTYLATLDANGKIPSSQLPSYVDDVLEYSSKASFPTTGETGKIYVDTTSNLIYRWGGSGYVEISPSLALGETSSTAYRGDRGKEAYEHSQKTSGNPHGVTKSDVGLGSVPNVETNKQTPTYSDTTSFSTLSSGETISIAFAKIKLAITNLINHIGNKSNPHGVTKAQVGLGNVENKSSSTIRGEITKSNVTTALGYTPLNQSLKGSASGLAELDSNGKVPSSQLPSFVDDVIEGYLSGGKFYKESAHTTEISGESGKIYIDLSTNKTYRWSGSTFVVISETLALGETSSTAYRGDRGKTAYDHSQSTHARTDATKVEKSSTNGNIKVNGTETNVYTHPSGTNPHGTTKSDVGLGNVDNTADADKSVKYAESAGKSNSIYLHPSDDTGITDFNSFEDGLYKLDRNSSMSNSPVGTNTVHGYLFQSSTTSAGYSMVSQIFIRSDKNHEMYTRSCWYGTWQSWSTILNNNNYKNFLFNQFDVKGTDTINDDTPSNWGSQKNSVHFYTDEGNLNGKPSVFGLLFNMTQGTTDVAQLWHAQPDGSLYHRGGNTNGWGSWKAILDSYNYSNYALSIEKGNEIINTLNLLSNHLKYFKTVGGVIYTTDISVNKGTPAGGAIYIASNNEGAGDATRLEIGYIRYGHSGNNVSHSVMQYASGSSVERNKLTIGCNDDGYLTFYHDKLSHNIVLLTT